VCGAWEVRQTMGMCIDSEQHRAGLDPPVIETTPAKPGLFSLSVAFCETPHSPHCDHTLEGPCPT
jgi:hypothetical protein